MTLISRKLGLPLRAMITPPRNVGKPLAAKEYLSADLYRRVSRACGPDLDLFYFAVDMLNAEIRSSDRFFSYDLQRLRLANWAALRLEPAVVRLGPRLTGPITQFRRAKWFVAGKLKGLVRRLYRLARLRAEDA